MSWNVVYRLVKQIPRGRVLSYGALAKALRLSGGARSADEVIAQIAISAMNIVYCLVLRLIEPRISSRSLLSPEVALAAVVSTAPSRG